MLKGVSVRVEMREAAKTIYNFPPEQREEVRNRFANEFLKTARIVKPSDRAAASLFVLNLFSRIEAPEWIRRRVSEISWYREPSEREKADLKSPWTPEAAAEARKRTYQKENTPPDVQKSSRYEKDSRSRRGEDEFRKVRDSPPSKKKAESGAGMIVVKRVSLSHHGVRDEISSKYAQHSKKHSFHSIPPHRPAVSHICHSTASSSQVIKKPPSFVKSIVEVPPRRVTVESTATQTTPTSPIRVLTKCEKYTQVSPLKSSQVINIPRSP